MSSALYRFLSWLAATVGISFVVAPNFLALLEATLDETFGTFFPVVPFATLLAVLLLLRWKEFARVLASENGWRSNASTRLLGVGIVAIALILRPFTSESVYLAGAAIALVAYGTFLTINPLRTRSMLPYSVVCFVGVVAPVVLLWGLGEPLAEISSALSAWLIGLSGIPVIWHGTQFQLTSKAGDIIAATVTPGCSSIISVTTFLGLLGLVHLDLRKDAPSTAKIAIAGTAVLMLLNIVRIAILIWVGYTGGSTAFWSLHNWVGYAFFMGFYLAILPIYSRMGGRKS